MTITYTDKPSITDTFANNLTYILQNLTDLDAYKKYKLITFTRDMTAATGTVAHTGVGFFSKSIIAFATLDPAVSFGLFSYDGMPYYMCAYQTYTLGWVIGNDGFIILRPSVGNSQYGLLDRATVTNDGFSIAWTKVGSPTGTATIIALCIR